MVVQHACGLLLEGIYRQIVLQRNGKNAKLHRTIEQLEVKPKFPHTKLPKNIHGIIYHRLYIWLRSVYV